MATRLLLADLAAAARAAGLPALEIESAGGVDAARRVAAGEIFDLVFLADDALARLADDGSVEAASTRGLVVSEVAVATASDSHSLAVDPQKAAFADAGGVRAALRAATRIGYSTGPSGTALVRMIDEWGMSAELGERLVQARPGIPVAQALAAREVDLGFQQVSELVGQPGVRIVGTLPPDCAIVTVFAGAVASASTDPALAARVLDFFASDAVGQIKIGHSFRLL